MTDSIRFYDTVPVHGLRRTADGYLVGEAPVSRSGVQLYAGHEVGRPELDIVRVYRPPDEVFSADALRSYAHRPITLGHPDGPVTADNWKQVAVGQTGDEVARDGDRVRVPLVLMDGDAIRKREAGFRELSMGYDAVVEFGDGVTPSGEKYDAVQRQMRMNHLALVPQARGGPNLRLGDDNGGAVMPETNVKLRTVNLDGLSVETTDAGAQAIERLQKDVQQTRDAADKAAEAHKEELATKDKDLAAKDAKIEELEKKLVSDEDLDKLVNARAELVATAKRIADIDYSGKSDSDIRKMAVVARLGDEAAKDKSDDYIAARFDILADDAGGDVQALNHRTHVHKQATGDGYAARDDRLANAWKGDQHKEAN